MFHVALALHRLEPQAENLERETSSITESQPVELNKNSSRAQKTSTRSCSGSLTDTFAQGLRLAVLQNREVSDVAPILQSANGLRSLLQVWRHWTEKCCYRRETTRNTTKTSDHTSTFGESYPHTVDAEGLRALSLPGRRSVCTCPSWAIK